ncbi:MAG: glycosyltransferase, partial [Sphingomonadales bacterium]
MVWRYARQLRAGRESRRCEGRTDHRRAAELILCKRAPPPFRRRRPFFANAWIEALACGTPLVITDCGGAREVLNHPAAGQIVDRSADAIARAIKVLLADPPNRKAVAACVAEYSWETNGAA